MSDPEQLAGVGDGEDSHLSRENRGSPDVLGVGMSHRESVRRLIAQVNLFVNRESRQRL